MATPAVDGQLPDKKGAEALGIEFGTPAVMWFAVDTTAITGLSTMERLLKRWTVATGGDATDE